ncbi:MAG: hypothetical protein RLZZ175_2153 [Bacteroidota bacterium]|jgi:hypothetical protein
MIKLLHQIIDTKLDYIKNFNMKRLLLCDLKGIELKSIFMFRIFCISLVVFLKISSAYALDYTVLNRYKNQKVIWAFVPASSISKVVINSNTTLNFPTQNPYLIAYFKMDPSGTLINVGQGIYKPNAKTIIPLKNDNTGNTGYLPNERYVTLIKDTVTQKTYAIEFNYKENKNFYSKNDSSEITSIKLAAWNNFPKDTISVCRNVGQNLSYTPIYGLGYQLVLYNPIKADTNTNVIYTDTLSVGKYRATILYFAASYLLDTLNFKVIDKPSVNTKTEVNICEGDYYSVKSPSIDYVLNDKNNNGLTLNKAGEYFYELNYKGYCPVKDTIVVSLKNCADNKNIISPNRNTKVSFKENGTVKIFNKYDQLITTLSAPVEWDGTDSNGNLLAPGVYFAVYENDNNAIALTILH